MTSYVAWFEKAQNKARTEKNNVDRLPPERGEMLRRQFRCLSSMTAMGVSAQKALEGAKREDTSVGQQYLKVPDPADP